MLVCTAYQTQKNELTVVNCGTSHLNPVTWNSYANLVYDYACAYPFEIKIKTPSISQLKSRRLFESRIYLEFSLPAQVIEKLSKVTGNKFLKQTSKRLNKLNEITCSSTSYISLGASRVCTFRRFSARWCLRRERYSIVT